MRIINLETFRKLPAGVLYNKYQPCVFDPLEMKFDTWEVDFLTQNLHVPVLCSGTDEFHEVLDAAEETGKSFSLDFKNDNVGRDGCFDNDQLFAVWERSDIEAFVAKLQTAIPALLP